MLWEPCWLQLCAFDKQPSLEEIRDTLGKQQLRWILVAEWMMAVAELAAVKDTVGAGGKQAQSEPHSREIGLLDPSPDEDCFFSST